MGTIFQAGGKPQWLTGIAAWRLVTMAALLYPAIVWGGLVGVCVLSAAVAVVDFFISASLVNRILEARLSTYARLLLPLFLRAGLAGGLGFLVERWLLSIGLWDLLALLTGGVVVVLVYGILMWWRDAEMRQEGRKLLTLVRERRMPRLV
jgi:hypothetical protein